ncbi:MAG: hypothetical protein IH991_09525 [Planctomycetes bacterium]|nr:hypothetical protein [Planctomycetota bacterium]
MTYWLATSFADVSSQAVASLVELSIKATVILALATAIAYLLRRRAAAMRHLVWLSTFVLLLALPLLSAFLPQWRALPNWEILAEVKSSSTMTDVDAKRSEPDPTARNDDLSRMGTAIVHESGPSRPADVEIESETELYAGQAGNVGARKSYSEASWQMQVAVATWFAGVLIAFLRILAAFISLARIRRTSEVISHGEVYEDFCHLVDELNIQGKVQLLRSGEHTMPMAWGVTRAFVHHQQLVEISTPSSAAA